MVVRYATYYAVGNKNSVLFHLYSKLTTKYYKKLKLKFIRIGNNKNLLRFAINTTDYFSQKYTAFDIINKNTGEITLQ